MNGGSKAIPSAASPAAVVDLSTPQQLISIDAKEQFAVVPSTIAALRALRGSIAVVTIAGPARIGKSTLLNRLLRGANDVPFTLKAASASAPSALFPVGDSVKPCTGGVWVCALTNATRAFWGISNADHVLVLDFEGLNSVESSRNVDSGLFVLGLLLGSVVLYTTRGVISSAELDTLAGCLLHAEKVKVVKSNDADVASRPAFVWVLLNFTTELTAADLNQPNAYLERTLRSVITPASARGVESSKRALTALAVLTEFPSRECITFPAATETSLNAIRTGLTEACKRVAKVLAPKRLCSSVASKAANGNDFADFCSLVVRRLNESKAFANNDAWSDIVSAACSRAADTAAGVFREHFEPAVCGRWLGRATVSSPSASTASAPFAPSASTSSAATVSPLSAAGSAGSIHSPSEVKSVWTPSGAVGGWEEVQRLSPEALEELRPIDTTELLALHAAALPPALTAFRDAALFGPEAQVPLERVVSAADALLNTLSEFNARISLAKCRAWLKSRIAVLEEALKDDAKTLPEFRSAVALAEGEFKGLKGFGPRLVQCLPEMAAAKALLLDRAAAKFKVPETTRALETEQLKRDAEAAAKFAEFQKTEEAVARSKDQQRIWNDAMALLKSEHKAALTDMQRHTAAQIEALDAREDAFKREKNLQYAETVERLKTEMKQARDERVTAAEKDHERMLMALAEQRRAQETAAAAAAQQHAQMMSNFVALQQSQMQADAQVAAAVAARPKDPSLAHAIAPSVAGALTTAAVSACLIA